jgi:DNA-binding response OmpR family regulator
VLIAHTGKKGLELAQENKFDLITLDADLPDINGFEICSELKQRHFSRHTPVVFVSACATLEDQQHALDLGAADFIEKPFDTQDFLSRILSLVEETATA